MKNIKICFIKKFTKDNVKCFEHFLVSFEVENILAEIKKLYKVELIKSEEDEFPYFTYGGFKYSGSDLLFNYEFVCTIENIL